MNMGNMEQLMHIKQAWNTFTANHPRFPLFLSSVKAKGIPEGTIIDVVITYPDGTDTKTNLKVTASDLQLIDTLRNLAP